MKILFFTSIIPYPLDEGGKTAQFYLLKEMSNKVDIAVVFQSYSKYDEEKIANFKKTIPSITVFTINMHSAKKNNGRLVKWVRILIWEVTKRLPKENKTITGSAYFTDPVRVFDENFVVNFSIILSQFQPDIVQVDFIDNAGIAYLVPKNIKKVLVFHDFRFQNVTRNFVPDGFSKQYREYLSSYIATKEFSVANFYDQCIVFSEDARKKAENLGFEKMVVSPFAVSDAKVEIKSDYKINKVVLLGPDHHNANLDALHWYANNLAEKVKSNFGLDTIVIGKWQNFNQEKFSKYSMIKFLGYVPDLETEMIGSVLFVPIRIGSGIRTKILDAFRLGVPVVSTVVGIEGINARNGIHYYEVDQPDDYLNALKHFENNSNELFKMRNAAFNFFEKNFSLKLMVENRLRLFEELIKITSN